MAKSTNSLKTRSRVFQKPVAPRGKGASVLSSMPFNPNSRSARTMGKAAAFHHHVQSIMAKHGHMIRPEDAAKHFARQSKKHGLGRGGNGYANSTLMKHIGIGRRMNPHIQARRNTNRAAGVLSRVAKTIRKNNSAHIRT